MKLVQQLSHQECQSQFASLQRLYQTARQDVLDQVSFYLTLANPAPIKPKANVTTAMVRSTSVDACPVTTNTAIQCALVDI